MRTVVCFGHCEGAGAAVEGGDDVPAGAEEGGGARGAQGAGEVGHGFGRGSLWFLMWWIDGGKDSWFIRTGYCFHLVSMAM